MDIVRVGKAIRVNRPDLDLGPNEELAFALAASMVPALERFLEERKSIKGGLDQTLRDDEAVQKLIGGLSQDLASAETILRATDSAAKQGEAHLARVEARPWKLFRWLWMLFKGRKWTTERREASQGLSQQRDEVRKQQELVDELRRRLEHANGQKAELTSRARDLQGGQTKLQAVPRIVEGIRSLDYPVFPLEIAGRTRSRNPDESSNVLHLFIDPNGDPQPVVVPAVGMDDKSLAELEDSLDRVDPHAILLNPGAEGGRLGSWRAIVGEEKQMLRIAQGLRDFAEHTWPERFDLPFIPKESALGRFLSQRLDADATSALAPASLDQATSMEIESYKSRKQSFDKVLSATQRRTSKFYHRLQDAATRFSTAHKEWEATRQNAQGVLQKYLKASQVNSRIVRYHFFCPSCNATPPYLERFWQISEADIEALNTKSLVGNLKRFQQRRFNSEEGKKIRDVQERARIEESWEKAFDELRELERRYRVAEMELSRLEHGGASGAASQLLRAFNRRELRNIQDWYRSLVRTLVRRPLDEWIKEESEKEEAFLSGYGGTEVLNPNTRLVYHAEDGSSGSWSCPLCNSSFDTETASLGSVDRLRYEVAYPLISTLWNQEAIWSKTLDALKDAGREIRDRVEQEMKALQGPIDNFKADIRQIRSRLDEATAKGRATAARLEQIGEQFRAVGLLPEKDLRMVSEAAQQIRSRVDEVDQRRRELEEFEQDMERVIREVKRERGIPVPPDRQFIKADADRGLLAFTGLHRIELVVEQRPVPTEPSRLDGQIGEIGHDTPSIKETSQPPPEAEPVDASGYLDRAVDSLGLGEIDGAREWVQRGLAHYPDDDGLRLAAQELLEEPSDSDSGPTPEPQAERSNG